MKINITSFGHGKPEFHNDLKNYLKSVFTELNLSSEITNDINENSINLLFEGFWPEYDQELTRKIKDKNYFKGLLNTEILVGQKNVHSKYFTYNNYHLQKKMINNKNILKELKFIHYLWKIKDKIIKFCNYAEQYRPNYYKVFKPFFYLLKKISKSNYEVTHNETSFFAYFFELSTHFKDIYNRTWKHFDNFDFILNIGSETIQKDMFHNKIPYFYLPFVYTDEYSKIFEIKNKNNNKKKYDFIFTGALTDYRLKLLKKLEEQTNLKIFYSDLIQDHDLRLQKISESRFFLGLKQNKFQTFISVNRIYNSIISEMPILVEGENYFTPDYFQKFIYMENTNNLANKMMEMSENYEFYKKDFKEKKNDYIKFSNNHKIKFKEFITNLKKNETFVK